MVILVTSALAMGDLGMQVSIPPFVWPWTYVHSSIHPKCSLQTVKLYSKFHLTGCCSPALKKWGYTVFAMSYRDSIIPWFRDWKIKMHFA